MNTKPKVSILCLTYNHERFIAQALESFLGQKTKNNFEVLINDDASTDGTAEIIREFQKKYPDIVKPIFQKENQYSKGVQRMLTKFLLPRAKGEYIAICEGDDFFTDELKIQLQVDFMEKNPECSLCFHPVKVFFENNEVKDCIFPKRENPQKLTTKDLLKDNFIPTSSVMYRSQEYKNLPTTNFIPGDWYLHLYHAKLGRIGFIDKVMSVYRRHSGGIWWDAYNNYEKLFKKYGFLNLVMYFELLKLYGEKPDYEEIILYHINYLIQRFVEMDEINGTKLIEEALSECPSDGSDYLIKCFLTRVTIPAIHQTRRLQYQLGQAESRLIEVEDNLNRTAHRLAAKLNHVLDSHPRLEANAKRTVNAWSYLRQGRVRRGLEESLAVLARGLAGGVKALSAQVHRLAQLRMVRTPPSSSPGKGKT
jgi:glycosyltransferase involved in cell wall biosynthesis